MMKIVKMGAEWCGPCRMVAPVLHEISNMDEFKNVEFKSYDVDNIDDECQTMIDKLQVKSIPVIAVIDENGNVVDKIIGALPKNQLIQRLKETING